MRRALPSSLFGLSLFALAAGCSTPPPTLKVSVAAGYDGLSCSSTESNLASLKPTTVRLSARVKDAKGTVTGVCDALISATAAMTDGFPGLGLGSTVDLYIEAFGGTGGTQRLATGALLGVDPTATSFPELRLFGAEEFRCIPGGTLAVPRAFHSATTLPNGQVLFVGGVTASADGTDAAAAQMGTDPSLYLTSAVELYDPVARKLVSLTVPSSAVARAFHHAALLPTSGTTYSVLLAGGLTPTTPGSPVLTTSTFAPLPAGFRFNIIGGTTAPTQILTYDPASSTVTLANAPAALQTVDAALQGAAALSGGGIALAGGIQFPTSTPTPVADLAVSKDGMTTQAGMLSQPREGVTLAGINDASGATSAALAVGGVMSGGDMPMAFERIDLTALKSTALAPTSAPLLPRYFLPTVTSMDAPSVTSPRLLISGGLAVNGLAINPPSTMGMTMWQVTYDSAAATLDTQQVMLGKNFGTDTCTTTLTHFRVVAFDAATLLPSGDRMLVTGGTPRNDPPQKCIECLDGDTSLTCASAQAAIVTVPAAGSADSPLINPEGQLQFGRFGHTQSVLPDGTVLIAGGLTRRSNATWAVAQTEIFNPARVTPPAPAAGSSVEIDDPLHAELAAMGLGRTPGAQAEKPGSTTAAIACPSPSK